MPGDRMLSVQKTNSGILVGSSPKNCNGIMSSSLIVHTRNGGPLSDYDDDGRFSSSEDEFPHSGIVAKNFCLPKSTIGNGVMNVAMLNNNNLQGRSKLKMISRNNSAPLSKFVNRAGAAQPPPLPPQKPKNISLVPTNYIENHTEAIAHSLVRSESLPTANVNRSFQLANQNIELNSVNQKKDQANNNASALAIVSGTLRKKSLPPPPPPPVGGKPSTTESIARSEFKSNNSAMHRSHSCATRPNNIIQATRKIAQCEEDLLEDFVWFHSSTSRQDAQRKLVEYGQEGGFLLRPKSDAVPNVPYSLSVFSNDKVYHLEIRLKHSGNFALGVLKDDEIEFSCLQALVSYYKRKSLHLLQRSTCQPSGNTILTSSPQKL